MNLVIVQLCVSVFSLFEAGSTGPPRLNTFVYHGRVYLGLSCTAIKQHAVRCAHNKNQTSHTMLICTGLICSGYMGALDENMKVLLKYDPF